jgi:hypothetical protein
MARPQGNKRRGAIGAALAACVLGATFVGIAITNAASAPIAPQHYTDYVMFAEAGLHVGFETQITGNIGARANRVKTPSPDVALRMGGGGTVLVGNAYVGQDVNLGNKSKITGSLVYKNKITKAATATYGSLTKADPGLPAGPMPSLWPTSGPSSRAQFCGSTQYPGLITKSNSQKITLTPGLHGKYQVGATTKLTFNGAGDYFLQGLKSGSIQFTFNTNGGAVRLFVCDEVELGVVSMPTNFTDPSKFLTEVWGTGGTDTNSFEATNGTWTGDVIVPRGGWHYGSGGAGSANIHGYVWAEHIDLEHHVIVHREETTPPAGMTTTTTTPTTKPTTTSTSTTTTTVPPTTTTTTTTSTTVHTTPTTTPRTTTTLGET